MKILITGKTGYIANHLSGLLKSNKTDEVKKISVRGDDWLKEDFSEFDTIVHLAGIAHHKRGAFTSGEYHRVNCDLALSVAKKAKEEGAKHFVFFSTMAVYGLEGKVNEPCVIDEKSPIGPKTAYAKSKLKGEEGLRSLEDSRFKVSILRPPMVYGPDSPGNFTLLRNLAEHFFIFPNIENQRSAIYVKNLCRYIEGIIRLGEGGIYYPQDPDYFNTLSVIRMIRSLKGKKTCTSGILGGIVSLRGGVTESAEKAFGNLTYSRTLSDQDRIMKNDWLTTEQAIKEIVMNQRGKERGMEREEPK